MDEFGEDHCLSLPVAFRDFLLETIDSDSKFIDDGLLSFFKIDELEVVDDDEGAPCFQHLIFLDWSLAAWQISLGFFSGRPAGIYLNSRLSARLFSSFEEFIVTYADPAFDIHRYIGNRS